MFLISVFRKFYKVLKTLNTMLQYDHSWHLSQEYLCLVLYNADTDTQFLLRFESLWVMCAYSDTKVKLAINLRIDSSLPIADNLTDMFLFVCCSSHHYIPVH